MDEQAPKRRWFQYRLSTWFVLVAILCWALTCHPYWVTSESRIQVSQQDFLSGSAASGLNVKGGGIEVVGDGPDLQPRVYYFTVDRSRPNPLLLGPAVALALFIVWTRFRSACTR